MKPSWSNTITDLEFRQAQAALCEHLKKAEELARKIRGDDRSKFRRQQAIRVELKVKEARVWNGDA